MRIASRAGGIRCILLCLLDLEASLSSRYAYGLAGVAPNFVMVAILAIPQISRVIERALLHLVFFFIVTKNFIVEADACVEFKIFIAGSAALFVVFIFRIAVSIVVIYFFI
jgi:hypothetical protein